MENVPPFNEQQLTSIAKILAESYGGLTGSEISFLLKQVGMPARFGVIIKPPRRHEAT
ncbi:MAG: hypothetical protein ACLQOO_14525 [Terriglobia bacterium]